ncbi:MAG: hypothetical protein ABI718_06335 [Acidobacteriota bacterium]
MDEKKPITAEADGPDDKGAVESEVERIGTIKGDEALGYEGEGREEHSGENEPAKDETLEDELADNASGQRPE